jgi:hypothetical protein
VLTDGGVTLPRWGRRRVPARVRGRLDPRSLVAPAADAGACFERAVGDRPARDGNAARDVGDWLGGIARGAACGADGGNVDRAAIVRHGRATYDPEARRVRRDAVDDPAGRGSRAAVEGCWGCLARRRAPTPSLCWQPGRVWSVVARGPSLQRSPSASTKVRVSGEESQPHVTATSNAAT